MNDYTRMDGNVSDENTPSARTETTQYAAKNVANSQPGWERETLEKLAMAAIIEQRQARRWRNGIRMAWLLFFVALVWFGMERGGAPTDVSSPHTAVVEIKGEIASGAETSADTTVSALRSAFEDKGAQGVVLLINSPGGSPVQAGIIIDEIHRLKKLHN